jgi:hypothetical protein
VLRELVANAATLPQRRAAVEQRLAVALWEDGGESDRARARVLAGDAERDYAAALERLKSWPPAIPLIGERLSQVKQWREHHR